MAESRRPFDSNNHFVSSTLFPLPLPYVSISNLIIDKSGHYRRISVISSCYGLEYLRYEIVSTGIADIIHILCWLW
jgi:hypothetical protein